MWASWIPGKMTRRWTWHNFVWTTILLAPGYNRNLLNSQRWPSWMQIRDLREGRNLINYKTHRKWICIWTTNINLLNRKNPIGVNILTTKWLFNKFEKTVKMDDLFCTTPPKNHVRIRCLRCHTPPKTTGQKHSPILSRISPQANQNIQQKIKNQYLCPWKLNQNKTIEAISQK